MFYSGLRAEVDRLTNEISDKNRIIDELNKIKADQEWSLGEHRQWLADANNRYSLLSSIFLKPFFEAKIFMNSLG